MKGTATLSDPDKDDHSGFVSPIAELIERFRQQEADNTGTRPTYAEIARRGTDITKGNVTRYASKPWKAAPGMEIEKRRGLALALRLHPTVVDLAMAQSVGLTLPIIKLDGDYRTDPDLLPEDVKAIDDYIAFIRDQRRRRGSG